MAHSSPAKARVHVLTVSDTRSKENDESGQICKLLLQAAGHEVAGYTILPDDPRRVENHCRNVAPDVDAILINGGTGISARDSTFEAIEKLLDKRLDGFGELFRLLSYNDVGPKAMASRAVAGVCKKTLIFSMPGSTKAVKLAMDKLISPELGHLVGELKK
jgi:molybdenum cofactor biosynthesis protein B